jgi:TolB-like protein/Tfp pilus assembly protein PilF
MTSDTRFSLLKELRRRRVFRTAGLYVVGAWLLLQAANILFPGWGVPGEAIRFLFWAALLGFPVALVFGWLFEITPEGIRRTQAAASQAELAASMPLRRTDYLILSVFVVVVGLIVYDVAGRVLGTAPLEERWSGSTELLERSVAVLPFTNLSGDPEQVYFSDGISEEILNRLAAFSELKVIARTSSFALKDSGYDVARISALLGVQYLLQGSVRRDGQQLRISAQLVERNGVQVWSSTFDRPLGGIFALQDEIAEAVATSIVPKISPPSRPERLPDLEAYQHYLMGREKLAHRTAMFWKLAADEFTRAIELDPEFAAAYADRAVVLTMGATWTPDHEAQYDQAQRDIDAALALNPTLAQAHAAQALLVRNRRPDAHAEAETLLRRALALDPNQADALNWLSTTLEAQGRHEEAVEALARAARIDPLSPAVNSNLALFDMRSGRLAEAERRLLRLFDSQQPLVPVYIRLLDLNSSTGRLERNVEVGKRVMLSLVPHTGRAAGNFGLVQAYAELGMREQAEHWRARFDEDHPEFYLGRLINLRILSHDSGLLDYHEALRRFHEVLASTGVALGQLPEDVLSFYAALHALAGDHEQAIQLLAPQVNLEAPYLDPVKEAFAAHALAWAYLSAGESERARRLLLRIDQAFAEQEARGQLHLGNERAIWAMTTVLLGDTERALDLLEQAEQAGWRRAGAVLHDPRWAAVRDEPHFQAVVARVQADVAAQRARVEARDAEDEFEARLDAAVAAQQAQSADSP